MAVVLMVKPDASANAAPPHLSQAFASHELIVASSIDEAVAASTRHTPDLILLHAALLPGGEQALMDGAGGAPADDRAARASDADSTTAPKWFYWFTRSKTASPARSMGPKEFLELARQHLGPTSFIC